MQKSGQVDSLSLQEIRSTNDSNCSKLIEAIGKTVDRNLSKSCSVVFVHHSYEYKIHISNKTSSVRLHEREKPGSTLKKNDEPTELHLFSYDRLKKSARLNNDGIYRGKLYGTIQLCKCVEKVDCLECNGTGICSSCEGEKQIVCPVCNGSKECPACHGSGRYTCPSCDGDGNCSSCEGSGRLECEECNGNGWVDCNDCNGTGNYIDTDCKYCNGYGTYYSHGREYTCKKCGGTGRYEVECRTCGGTGNVECNECDGDGWVDCDDCNGSGTCSRCSGEGDIPCKACKSTGKCGKCRAKGKIWCPECSGKGICFDCKGEKLVQCPRCKGLGEYQSYTEYSLKDTESKREMCSLSINKKDIQSVTGDIIYNSQIYDFFAGRANIYDDKTILEQVTPDKIELVRDWISLEKNSMFSKDKIGNDYLSTTAILSRIPVSKLILKCNSTNYTIWVVGNNKVIFYDDLPSLAARFLGSIGKLFGSK